MTQSQTKTTTRKTATAPATPAAAVEAPREAATPKGKLGTLVALLLQPEGTTLAAMQEATGWQAHSVRGAISGSIKKKLGFAVASDKSEAGRVYRIVKGAGA